MTEERIDYDLICIPLAARALLGHQVISIEKVYRLFGGGDPAQMDDIERKLLRQILTDIGYVERWVTKPYRDEMFFMWIRDPWALDHLALRDREVEVYVPFY